MSQLFESFARAHLAIQAEKFVEAEKVNNSD